MLWSNLYSDYHINVLKLSICLQSSYYFFGVEKIFNNEKNKL